MNISFRIRASLLILWPFYIYLFIFSFAVAIHLRSEKSKTSAGVRSFLFRVYGIIPFISKRLVDESFDIAANVTNT